jgi:hypothetical protein
MALTKVEKLDKIEIVGDFKHIQCRHATWVEDDGEVIGGKQFHRHVIAPNDDVSSEPQEVQDIAAVVHTQAIKDAYTAHLAAQEL